MPDECIICLEHTINKNTEKIIPMNIKCNTCNGINIHLNCLHDLIHNNPVTKKRRCPICRGTLLYELQEIILEIDDSSLEIDDSSSDSSIDFSEYENIERLRVYIRTRAANVIRNRNRNNQVNTIQINCSKIYQILLLTIILILISWGLGTLFNLLYCVANNCNIKHVIGTFENEAIKTFTVLIILVFLIICCNRRSL